MKYNISAYLPKYIFIDVLYYLVVLGTVAGSLCLSIYKKNDEDVTNL